MRLIGHLDGEASARKLGDYLAVQGIENAVEAEKDGVWAVWIHAEEELERGTALLEEFRRNPADSKYQAVDKTAQELRDKKKKEQEAYEKRLKSRRHLFRPLKGYGMGPITFVLILVSAVVFVLTKFGDSDQAMMPFHITEYTINADSIEWYRGLREIRHGEVWRLLTPMFLHYGPMHILFNMYWLVLLGSMIEARQGSGTMLILVLVFAAISNYAQYLVSGPSFGGMSGVDYGLVGYIWIRGKRDPGSGLFLNPTTVGLMIFGFFAGLAGMRGVANTAHGSGLLAGMLWGFLSSLRYR